MVARVVTSPHQSCSAQPSADKVVTEATEEEVEEESDAAVTEGRTPIFYII